MIRRWPLVIVGLAACTSVARFATPDTVLDDAFITLRAARSWMEQGTPAVQLGAADASTSVPWLWLARLFLELGVDPLTALRVLGAACHVGASVLIAAAAAALAPRSARAALAAGLLVALSGSLAFHATAGLETGLWALALATAIYGLAARRRTPLLLGILLVAAARPEGLLLAPCLVGLVVWKERRLAPQAALAAAIGAGAVALFRWHYFHALLPNTYWAKPPDPLEGAHDLGSFAVWGLGGLLPLACVPALRRPSLARGLVIIATVMALGTVWSGGDWMPGYRRFTAAYLCVAVVAGAGIGISLRLSPWLGFVAGITAHVASAAGGRDLGRYNPEGMPFVARLVADSPGIDEVALVDIGAFGWHYRGRIYDVAGLSDAHIAARPGGHLEKWDAEEFARRRPDLALVELNPRDPELHPFQGGYRVRSRAEACLIGAALRLGYRPVTTVRTARDIYLLALLRPGRSLPESVWGPPLPIDADELARQFPACP